MNFTLHRNAVITSTLGYAIEFTKGVPTYVPKEMYKDVMAIGAQAEQSVVDDIDETPSSPEPTDPIEREALIIRMMESIIELNNPLDFNAAGAPDIKVLHQRLGFPVHQKERDKLLRRIQGNE